MSSPMRPMREPRSPTDSAHKNFETMRSRVSSVSSTDTLSAVERSQVNAKVLDFLDRLSLDNTAKPKDLWETAMEIEAEERAEEERLSKIKRKRVDPENKSSEQTVVAENCQECLKEDVDSENALNTVEHEEKCSNDEKEDVIRCNSSPELRRDSKFDTDISCTLKHSHIVQQTSQLHHLRPHSLITLESIARTFAISRPSTEVHSTTPTSDSTNNNASRSPDSASHDDKLVRGRFFATLDIFSRAYPEVMLLSDDDQAEVMATILDCVQKECGVVV